MVGKHEPIGTTSPASRLSLGLRLALSAVLLFHLVAVFLPPFTFATRTAGVVSPFAEPIMAAWRPYVDLLFLEHGYFFFAPNPGPSHLLRAKLEFADGQPPRELTFPDRTTQKPRLLYHRHFMLAEQLHDDFVPPQPPADLAADPQQTARWRQARDHYELRRRSYEEHLRATYGASRVTLVRIEHSLFGPAEFQELRKPIDAAETYRELPEEPGEVQSPVPGVGR